MNLHITLTLAPTSFLVVVKKLDPTFRLSQSLLGLFFITIATTT